MALLGVRSVSELDRRYLQMPDGEENAGEDAGKNAAGPAAQVLRRLS